MKVEGEEIVEEEDEKGEVVVEIMTKKNMKK